jgi:post-segregation antitoxin (ccd killing protein)
MKTFGNPDYGMVAGSINAIKFPRLTAAQTNIIMCGRRTAMQKTKLTVRVPRDLLENIKRYAAQNSTTLTSLIEAYLRRIPSQQSLENAPIVSRLSGILSQDVTIHDYKKHLEEKYSE